MEHFYRIEKDEKLAGVCTGIAEYCDIDVTLVRLAFVFGSLVWGVPIFVYIILAIVAPKK